MDGLPSASKPFYPLHEIATLIAMRVQPPGEELRTTLDKVRKRLIYALRKDELQLMTSGPLELFFGAQVFAWARKKWPEAFGDIPVTQDAKGESHLKIGITARTFLYPGSLEDCHKLLRSTYDEVDLLEQELRLAELEVTRLKPLAERYEQNREKNRRSAKKPRKDV
jgi:hypothetical protein